MLKVKDLMRQHPPVLQLDTGLADAVDAILKSGYLGLPVVDENSALTGFLSEQDCIKALITDSYHCDTHIHVRDIMRADPLFVSPQLSILELSQILGRGQPKIFPVVDEDVLVGLITRGDVMKSLNESLQSCRAS